MPRYFTRPRSFYVEDEVYDDPIRQDAPQVSDHEAVDTGLVDQNGSPIMRAPNPMGFGKDDEW